MWWELSGDCDAEKGGMHRALIPKAGHGVSDPAHIVFQIMLIIYVFLSHNQLGQLDQTTNNLHYPYSQYDNVRSGL